MEILIKGLENDFLLAQYDSNDFKIDIAKDANRGNGPRPLELFLSGICACVGVYVKKYLKSFSSELNNVSIKVIADLTQESPYRFDEINVQIRLPFELGERKRALLNFVKNCPVHNTIAGSVDFNFEALTIKPQDKI